MSTVVMVVAVLIIAFYRPARQPRKKQSIPVFEKKLQAKS
jgi:hypothetical protein